MKASRNHSWFKIANITHCKLQWLPSRQSLLRSMTSMTLTVSSSLTTRLELRKILWSMWDFLSAGSHPYQGERGERNVHGIHRNRVYKVFFLSNPQRLVCKWPWYIWQTIYSVVFQILQFSSTVEMVILFPPRHNHLLKHPLCESFLHLKWQKVFMKHL